MDAVPGGVGLWWQNRQDAVCELVSFVMLLCFAGAALVLFRLLGWGDKAFLRLNMLKAKEF